MILSEYKRLNYFLNRREQKLNVQELVEFTDLLKKYRQEILRELELAGQEADGVSKHSYLHSLEGV